MKTCPYCAEEVQDAAVVCKHCGRDLTPRPPAGAAAPTKPGLSPTMRLVALVALLLVVGGVYIVQHASRAAPPPPPARVARRPAPPPPPIVVAIADGKPLELKPQAWHDYPFTLPSRACTVTGRVEGVSGGGHDFEAVILDDDNYRNWSTDHRARGVGSGRVVVWTPEANLQGPGTFHLVVSNAFSAFTRKVVTAQASALCP